MKHLYYVRHGVSEANLANMWSGTLNVPLAPEGHEQAKLAGQKAAKDGIKFDLIMSSPLDRAQQTAQHIARATGYPIEDIVTYDRIIERNFGELEGTSNPEAAARYRQGEALIDDVKGIERFVDLHWRADEVLAYLKQHPHDTILVVSHGAFGRALRRRAEGIPLTEYVQPFPNGEIYKLL